jgi:excisionase family DNA binding protein
MRPRHTRGYGRDGRPLQFAIGMPDLSPRQDPSTSERSPWLGHRCLHPSPAPQAATGRRCSFWCVRFPSFLARTPDWRCLRGVLAGEVASLAVESAPYPVRLVRGAGARDGIGAQAALVLGCVPDEVVSSPQAGQRMTDWAERIGRHITAEGSVVVPPRIAAALEEKAGLTADRQILVRDNDPLAYEVLAALHLAALIHSSGSGTKLAAVQHGSKESDQWLTTTEAAAEVGVTDRCIRKWITTGRLPARQHGNRYLIDRQHLTIQALAA